MILIPIFRRKRYILHDNVNYVTIISAAKFDPLDQFTFSTTPPEYMWYDISGNSKSDEPFEIDCDGSLSFGSASIIKEVRKGIDLYTSLPYNFESDIKSEKSGVYQCGMMNDPEREIWYQKTTNVIIACEYTL